MTAIYLDTSAFVKIVVPEPESSALRRYLAAADATLTSSALLRVEAPRAVRHVGPEALARTRVALRRMNLVAVVNRILDSAGILEPGIMRALDAIHVATAMEMLGDLGALVSYDRRMLDAAALLGIPTETPR